MRSARPNCDAVWIVVISGCVEVMAFSTVATEAPGTTFTKIRVTEPGTRLYVWIAVSGNIAAEVAVRDARRVDPDDGVPGAVGLEAVTDVEPEVLCGAPAQHHLVSGRLRVRPAGDDGDAELTELVRCNADLNEERVVPR